MKKTLLLTLEEISKAHSELMLMSITILLEIGVAKKLTVLAIMDYLELEREYAYDRLKRLKQAGYVKSCNLDGRLAYQLTAQGSKVVKPLMSFDSHKESLEDSAFYRRYRSLSKTDKQRVRDIVKLWS